MPTVFEAKYHGTCENCLEPVTLGQMAYFNTNDEVVHTHCPERVRDDDPSKACKDCHLIHPGDCE